LLFLPPVRWNDQEDVLANRLGRRVAKKPLRASIPRSDDAIQRLAHDGIVGRINNRRQPRAEFVALQTRSDITCNLRRADDASRSIRDRRDRQRNINQPAVLRLPDGLKVVDSFTTTETSKHPLLFLPAVPWNDQEDVLANRLGRRVPEKPFRASLPRGEDDTTRLAHHR